MLSDKCIIIGVTGGIAAYKVPDLVSKLVKAGADVHVIMTESAAEFITPLTLQTISRNPVTTEMFAPHKEWQVQHVSLADRADILVVVPATANIIGKVCAGIADDILSTTVMVVKTPVLFAPAMNAHMYENRLLQANITKLKSNGYHFMEPDLGRLACGYEGKGRLPDIETIFDRINSLANPVRDIAGKIFLITAGPTREYIDPVRFITNGSTGKMGYAVAEAARERGAQVILVSGPVNIPVPKGVTCIQVVSAQEMSEAVDKNFKRADVIIKTAAVGDYAPKVQLSQKMKKGQNEWSLELAKTPDILKNLGEKKGNRILIGFAVETNDLIENARKKIKDKNLDFIVANDITLPGAGFGTDTNIVKLIYKDGRVEACERMTKNEVAHLILDKIVGLNNPFS